MESVVLPMIGLDPICRTVLNGSSWVMLLLHHPSASSECRRVVYWGRSSSHSMLLPSPMSSPRSDCRFTNLLTTPNSTSAPVRNLCQCRWACSTTAVVHFWTGSRTMASASTPQNLKSCYWGHELIWQSWRIKHPSVSQVVTFRDRRQSRALE